MGNDEEARLSLKMLRIDDLPVRRGDGTGTDHCLFNVFEMVPGHEMVVIHIDVFKQMVDQINDLRSRAAQEA